MLVFHVNITTQIPLISNCLFYCIQCCMHTVPFVEQRCYIVIVCHCLATSDSAVMVQGVGAQFCNPKAFNR